VQTGGYKTEQTIGIYSGQVNVDNGEEEGRGIGDTEVDGSETNSRYKVEGVRYEHGEDMWS